MNKDFLNNNKEDVELPEIVERCPYCDEPLGEDREFCHKCGKFLKKEGKSSYTPMSEKQATKIRVIIGIVAVIIFAVIYFVVRK